MLKKIILKIGGSVITKKDVKDFPLDMNEIKRVFYEYVRVDEIKRLGRELYEAIKESGCRLILINGAGPFGHYLVYKKQPVEIVHKSVEYLNRKLIEYLDNDLNIQPVAPFDTCEWKHGEFDISRLWEKGQRVLEDGKILSTYGDVLQGYKIISGDDLAVLLAEHWQADKIIMATDVNGVYDRPPENEDAKLIKTIRGGEDIEFRVKAVDVTGGIKRKIMKLQSVGINSQIVNGLVAGNVKKVLLGDESIGTLIIPASV